MGKAFVIVLRYIDDWFIKQRVCRLMLLAKSITGEEVMRQLATALSTELSIIPDMIVAAMRDRASINDVAMRTVLVVYNHLMDVPCFSHTLNHVGEGMNTPILDDFTKVWISLFPTVRKRGLHGRRLLVCHLLLTHPPCGGVSLKLCINYTTCLEMYLLFFTAAIYL